MQLFPPLGVLGKIPMNVGSGEGPGHLHPQGTGKLIILLWLHLSIQVPVSHQNGHPVKDQDEGPMLLLPSVVSSNPLLILKVPLKSDAALLQSNTAH